MGNDPLGGRTDSSGGVQSVDRAITILEILAERREAGVSEIAQEISVHKSTAFRLLGALFDDVHIPAENLIGQVNDGWSCAVTTLLHERL
ncbi:helix-turn-helix domain-containing protein, partial [Streptosporangium sp. NPDC006013]|uniref:helix-turn-helix domain-containing protein n=1 Tax=Streptosporangium sp. NPDC006013 TaxID=3155596 RepID=UPI0033AA75D3